MRQLSVGIALLAAAGCSYSHGKIGEQKDASLIDAPRIDAPLIDAPMSDAPGDATVLPPTDTDSDGVADASDNCPTVANMNQRNHDADTKGDACDGCPHLASTTDPDGDSDGVGDACDPRPATAGDSRALFEGFYDATSIAGWAQTGNGTWAVANGVLTQSSTTTSTTTNAIGPSINVQRAAVTTGAKLLALGNETSGFDAPHVSVAAGVAQNTSYWCTVLEEGNDRTLYASVFRPNMGPSFPNTPWPGTFGVNSEFEINLVLLGGNNTCTVVQGMTNESVAGTTSPTVPGGPQVATRTASASFDYLFVVSIGN